MDYHMTFCPFTTAFVVISNCGGAATVASPVGTIPHR